MINKMNIEARQPSSCMKHSTDQSSLKQRQDHIPNLVTTKTTNMCHHRLYVFTTCGHSYFASTPILTCRHASIEPTATFSRSCMVQAHPFQTLKIEKLCRSCEYKRTHLLSRLESKQIVRFDEWKWKVSYITPDDGFESPTDKSKKGLENKTGAMMERNSAGRWSWKRRGR